MVSHLGLPLTATSTGQTNLPMNGSFRAAPPPPRKERGYPAQVVLVLCVASFLVGRCVNLFSELEELPDPSSGPSTVQTENSSPGRVEEVSAQPQVRNNLLEVEGALPLASITDEKLAEAKREAEYLALEIAQRSNFVDKEISAAPRKPPEEIQQHDLDRIGSELLSDVPALTPTESGNEEYRTMPFQVLSWYPRIVLFPKFLDHEKCDHVIEIGKTKLHQSGLVLRKGETTEGTKDIRTSSGTFLHRGQDKEGVLGEIEDRIADWTSLPVKHGEPFNLLHYEHGQHYDSHYDAFDETYGPQATQRLATVLVYLSTVEEGGETVFPLEGQDGLSRLAGIDYKRCDLGFKYKPRKGDALLFYSLHPNGTIDRHSLHGGCPVIKGDKWVMTKWIRDKCFGRC